MPAGDDGCFAPPDCGEAPSELSSAGHEEAPCELLNRAWQKLLIQPDGSGYRRFYTFPLSRRSARTLLGGWGLAYILVPMIVRPQELALVCLSQLAQLLHKGPIKRSLNLLKTSLNGSRQIFGIARHSHLWHIEPLKLHRFRHSIPYEHVEYFEKDHRGCKDKIEVAQSADDLSKEL